MTKVNVYSHWQKRKKYKLKIEGNLLDIKEPDRYNGNNRKRYNKIRKISYFNGKIMEYLHMN